MSERRVLALLALLLGLIAALLLMLNLRFPGNNEDFLVYLRVIAVNGILGLIALATSILIWTRQYRAGGVIALIVAAVIIILTGELVAGLLLAFSGILGLVAAGTFADYQVVEVRR